MAHSESSAKSAFMKVSNNKALALGVLVTAIAVVGCNPPDVPPAAASASVAAPEVNITSKAGVSVAAAVNPVPITAVASAKRFDYRPDPFALTAKERKFESEQESLRVFGELGGAGDLFTPEEEKEAAVEYPEPQPYRRLAGVVVGDSILALVDMGDGTGLKVIRPGQNIEGSEWRVASIDSEKAVLVRSGNRTPRRIVVKLEAPAFGTSTPGSSFGGGMGSGPGFGGGRPGGMPGGRPGAGGGDGDLER